MMQMTVPNLLYVTAQITSVPIFLLGRVLWKSFKDTHYMQGIFDKEEYKYNTL